MGSRESSGEEEMIPDVDKPSCPQCGCTEKIGIEIRGVYDGVLFWRCLACGCDYHRWEDDRMRAKAEKHMQPRKEKL